MSVRGNIYDIFAAYAFRINGSAEGVGQLDPDAVGVGPTVSPAYLLKAPISFKPAQGSRATVEWRGGGRPEGKVQSGIDSIGEAELTLSQWDSGLSPFINDGKLDTTSLVNAEISSPNNMNPAPREVALVVIVRVNRQDSIKAQYYTHFVYPRCTITRDQPSASQVDGNQKNPNPITLKITPNTTDHFPVGIAFGTNQAWYQNTEFEFMLTAPYPYFHDTWIADGVATTFNLTYLPKKSTVTTGNTDNWVTKNGAATAPTSISTSTKAVVVSAAGSASDIWNVWYPVDPALIV
jgi:hypothetical protein